MKNDEKHVNTLNNQWALIKTYYNHLENNEKSLKNNEQHLQNNETPMTHSYKINEKHRQIMKNKWT